MRACSGRAASVIAASGAVLHQPPPKRGQVVELGIVPGRPRSRTEKGREGLHRLRSGDQPSRGVVLLHFILEIPWLQLYIKVARGEIRLHAVWSPTERKGPYTPGKSPKAAAVSGFFLE